jgi:nitrite reductase/ring-hydroxylating ferredoxin subunit
MPNFVRVASINDVPPGQGTAVEADGHTIALFNVSGTFYAIGNTCLHRGGPLGEGLLDEKIVTCPWHGWRFDVTNGAAEANPTAKVPVYPVKVEGQDLYVGL